MHSYYYTVQFILLYIIQITNQSIYKYNYRDLFNLNKRHNNNNYYLDQCEEINFIVGQLGIVNVLIFLDDSWPFSYKQATMLKELKNRLERSRVPETLFFAVIKNPTSSSSSMIDVNDDNVEREAWMNVSPDEIIEMSSINNNIMNVPLIKIISNDIFVIEDNDDLNIWYELKGSRDQIIIIDNCGRLTYQIIIPWSILHFPYAKAAILSTHNDNPCGYCDNILNYNETSSDNSDNIDINSNNNTMTIDKINNTIELIESIESSSTYHINNDMTIDNIDEQLTTSTDTITQYPDKYHNEIIKFPDIRIIMRAPHYHIDNNSTNKHEHLILKLNDQHYHEHIDGINYSNSSYILRINDTINNESTINRIVFDKDESPGGYGEVSDYWRHINNDYYNDNDHDNNNDNINSELNNSNDESMAINNDEMTTIENNDDDSRDKLLEHYSRLLPWLYYVLKK